MYGILPKDHQRLKLLFWTKTLSHTGSCSPNIFQMTEGILSIPPFVSNIIPKKQGQSDILVFLLALMHLSFLSSCYSMIPTPRIDLVCSLPGLDRTQLPQFLLLRILTFEPHQEKAR